MLSNTLCKRHAAAFVLSMLKINSAELRCRRLQSFHSYADFAGVCTSRILATYNFFKRCWNVVKTSHWCDRGLTNKVLKCMRRTLAFLAHLSTKCSVSFCDPSMSGVRRPSVRCASVCPSVNNFFKQHLLWNRLLDFDQTSQEWSLGGPLSKLFKPFCFVA